MRKSTKIWLVVAIALILIGVMAIESVMTVLDWDIEKLSISKYATKEDTINEEYRGISIVTDTADVVIAPSKDGKTIVVCHEQENEAHTVAVKDGRLTIELTEHKQWYDHIGIDFGTPKVTVYIPAGEHGALSVKLSTGDVTVSKDFEFEHVDIAASTGDVTSAASASGAVKIKTGTGDIRVQDASVASLELSVSTGRVMVSRVSCEGNVTLTVSTGKSHLSDMTCQSFTSSGDTGDISMENVIAAGNVTIERTTGDVELERCDAAELWIKTSTGDVEGLLLSEKVFIVHTRTGDFDVPKTASGGKCEVTTSTGDIEFEIQ